MITNNIVVKDGEVGIYGMSITYMQNADCCSNQDDYQFITLEMRNGGTEPSDSFVHIKTGDSGWSVDDGENMKDIVDDFMNRYNAKKNEVITMTLEERDAAIEAIKQRKLDKLSEIRPYKRKQNKRKKWCIVDEIKEKKRAYAREWYAKKKREELLKTE